MQHYISLSSANNFAKFSRERKAPLKAANTGVGSASISCNNSSGSGSNSISDSNIERGLTWSLSLSSKRGLKPLKCNQLEKEPFNAGHMVAKLEGLTNESGSDKSVKFETNNQLELVGAPLMGATGRLSPSSNSEPSVANGEPGLQAQDESTTISQKSSSSHKQQPTTPTDDEDSKAEARLFDLIIFAASSSIGQFLVEEMALVIDKHYSVTSSFSSSSSPGVSVATQFAQNRSRRQSVPSSAKSNRNINWAVSGRSAIRLAETLCRAELSTGIRDLSSSVPVVLADLNHHRSLLDMCKQTKMVINCAGPYSDLGAETLIEACIQCRTNYIDLAHETTFVEMIAKNYSEQARQNGIFILNGCGFQSMSAEMGLNFTKQVADGRIEQVKIILSLSDTKSIPRLGSQSPASSKFKGHPSSQRATSRLLTGGIVSEGMWNSLLSEKARELSVEERFQSKQATCLLASHSDEESISGDDDDDVQGKNRDNNYSSQVLNYANGPQEPSRLILPTTSNCSTSHVSRGDLSIAKRPTQMLKRKDTQSLVRDIVLFRNRNVTSLAWPLQLVQNLQHQKGRGYCWPIDSLTSDESQLIRGEMNNYELRRPDLNSTFGWRPIRCSTFLSVKSFTQICLLFLWSFIFQIVVKFSVTRFIMRKLPQLVSLGHVNSSNSIFAMNSIGSGSSFLSGHRLGNQQTQKQLDRNSLSHIKYCQTFIAYGTPGENSGDPLEERRKGAPKTQVQLLVARVVGPEPNHVTTATFCIQAALTLLTERDHLPCQGGVLTPGAAFSETNIIYQLRRRNIKFEVLKKA